MQNNSRESSENNFISLLNFIVDPAVIVDEKGRILLMNNALEDITGFSAKEVTGKIFLEVDILTAESKASMLENLKKRMQGLPIQPYEITFTDKNGEIRYVEVKAKKISYTGQPADLVIFRDITRRKKNLAKLKEYSEKMEALVNEKVKEIEESKERYRELTESVSDVFFAMDKDLKYTYWNKASEKLTGILAKDAIGKSLTEVFPDVKGTRVEQFYQEVLRTKQSQSFLNKFRIGDMDFTFEINAYPTMTGLSVFVKDITERKTMEEALRESEEKYRTQFEEALDAVIVADAETGIIIDCNHAASKLVDREKSEIVGKHQRILHPPEEIAGNFSRTYKQHRKEKEGQVLEAQVITKKGEIKDVAIKANVFDLRGKKLIQGIFRDITERKKAEEELRMSEEKYRELINGMNDTAWVIGLDGMFIDVNDAAVRVLGYSREELLSMGPWDIDSSLSREQIVDLVTRMPADQIQVFETSHTTKDGKKIPVEISSSLVIYQGKQAILSIARDITERKQLEEDLRSSEEKFRAISASAVDAIILLDETDKVIYWNPTAERIFGFTTEEAVGKEFWKLIVPQESRENHLMLLEKFVRQKEQIPEKRIDIKALRKDGTEFPIELSATALKLKDKTCLLEIIRDVSERKKMEAEVKQKLDMLEALTENLGVGLGVISKDYHVLWMNRFIKNNTGDVTGKLCYSGFNTLDHICPDCGVKKVFEEGVARDSHEYSTTGIHGKPYYVELIATPLKDKDGNITAALEFVVDIAEKKRMQNELKKYSQKLEQLVAKRTEQLKQTQTKLLKAEKLAAIGELAGMVGHDLRNPLTGIKGAEYYLKTKCAADLSATGKEMLEIIDKAIEHSNKIINDLLAYSSKLSLDLSETTPKLLLKNALALIEVPERIRIINATKGKPKIKADIENMQKVFVNLINNAIDAMPKTGTLTITSKAAKGNVKIVFKDTGTGMTEETLYKLKLGFPLFTTKSKGMGFGLPICKRIVESHGGKISLKSKLGKGTEVTIMIPVNPKLVKEGEEKWIFNESALKALRAAQEVP